MVGLDECGTKETAPEPYGTFVKVDIAGDEQIKYAATLEALRQAVDTQLARTYRRFCTQLRCRKLRQYCYVQ